MATRPPIVVTRPQPQAAATCQALEQLGYRAVALPLLTLTGLDQLPPSQSTFVQRLAHYHAVIFISANAVRFGLPWLLPHWPRQQLPVCFAIGEATRKALEKSGISALTHGEHMTSETLLAHPQLEAIRGQRILIVKGVGGRGFLSAQLNQRGATADELCCYRRSCPEFAPGELYRQLHASAAEAILVSSGEGLANMLTLLSVTETSNLRATTLVVPSSRVARLARDAGFESVLTAVNASDTAMFDALIASGSAPENNQ